jgi:hypothetical protein
MLAYVLEGVLEGAKQALELSATAPNGELGSPNLRKLVCSVVRDLTKVTPNGSCGSASVESKRAWVGTMQLAAQACEKQAYLPEARYAWSKVARACRGYGGDFLPDSSKAFLRSYHLSCMCHGLSFEDERHGWATQAEIAHRGLCRVFKTLSPEQKQSLMPDFARVTQNRGTLTPSSNNHAYPPAELTSEVLNSLLPIPKKTPTQ